VHTRAPPNAAVFPYTTLFRSEAGGEPLPRVGHVVAEIEEEPGPDGAQEHRPVGEAQPLQIEAGERAVERVEAARVLDLVRLELRSEEHTSELQSRENLVCRLL